MRFYLICDDPDTLTGFRLAGVEGVIVRDRESAEKALSSALKMEDVAVLLISENAAAMTRQRVDELRVDVLRPLISIIPGPDAKGGAHDSIKRLITETIGVKL